VNGRARGLVVVATGAAVLLVAVYAALGGGRYTPPKTADPCDQRTSSARTGIEALAERLVLSALDGAACELGTSREEITLAFFSDEERGRFARKHDLDAGDVERAVRAALIRAIRDAERRGSIDEVTARLVSAVVAVVPLDRLVDNLPRLKEKIP
jgi:hypothetical protein